MKLTHKMNCTPVIIILICLLQVSLPAFSAPVTEPVRFHYSGTVGDMPVQMDLTFRGMAINGDYYYNRIGESITLRGSLGSKSPAVVREYPGGRKTGSFTGRFDPFRMSWSGVWKSADGKRSMPFKVAAVATYVREKGKSGNIDVEATYPQFTQALPAAKQLNTLVRSILSQKKKNIVRQAQEAEPIAFRNGPWTFVYESDIAYASKDLVSLIGSTYTYTGGAHGMTSYSSANYQITNGSVKQLGMNDLFKQGTPYLSVLSNEIIGLLRQKDAMWVTTGQVTSFEPKDLSVYSITPKGLTFYFDPYAVGSYAQGAFMVTVPYSVMSGYIREGGPLHRFVR
jgi:hypothetical protein